MPPDIFLAMLVFAFVASITPGPNNFLLLASGVNFGFRRTLPHMAGSCLGFLWLLLAMGLGLSALLTLYPRVHLALKLAGGAWLLYLAWKTGTARALSDRGPVAGAPMTFLQATMFTWVNPKAWVSALAGMAIYADPARPWTSILLVCAAFVMAGFPACPPVYCSAWACEPSCPTRCGSNGSISAWDCCWQRRSGRCCARRPAGRHPSGSLRRSYLALHDTASYISYSSGHGQA